MVGMQGRQASLSLAGGQPLPLLHRGMEAVPSLLPYRHTILWKLVSPRSLGMGCALLIPHSPGGKDPWYQLSSPAFFLTPFLPIWHLQGETAAPQKWV